MAYTPTQKDFEGLSPPAGYQAPTRYIPTAADFEGLSPPGIERGTPAAMKAQLGRESASPFDRHIHDYSAGVINPWIHALNLLPGVKINPRVPYDANSFSSILGQLEGAIAPFMTGEGAIAEGLGAIPKLGRAMGIGGRAISPLEKLGAIGQAPSIARSAGAGALSGGLTSTPGQREQNALLGGLLAGGTHGVGQLVGQSLHTLPLGARVQKAASLYAPPITGEPEDAVKNATNQIASNYLGDLNEARSRYGNVLKRADKAGVKFGANDFPHYQKAYEELADKNMLPGGAGKPGDMLALYGRQMPEGQALPTPQEEQAYVESWLKGQPDLGKTAPSASPLVMSAKDVHLLKSQLGTRAYKSRMAGNGIEATNQQALKEALSKDLMSQLTSTNPQLARQYGEATHFFKTKVGPYRSHAGFKKMVNAIEERPSSDEDLENQLFQLNWHGKSPNSLIRNLVPSNADTGMDLLNSFQKDLMGGNAPATSQVAKNLLFSKYASPLNGEVKAGEIETPNYKFDMGKFLNHYNKLSSKQLNYLFEPDEKSVLDKFSKHADKLKKPNAITQLGKRALGTALGYLVGGHMGAGNPLAKAAGEVAGAVLAQPAEAAAHQTAKALMPNTLEKLLKGMESYSPTFRTTRLPAALSVGGLQMLQDPGGL